MPHKQKEVGAVARKYDLDIIGIVDTRVQETNMQMVLNNCLPGWGVFDNYSVNGAGRIWLCWKPTVGIVRCIDIHEQSITVEVTKSSGTVLIVTMVYASTDGAKRRELWNNLVRLSSGINIPWIVLGDFNSILSSQERVGGGDVRPHHFADFLDCVTIAGLTDMRYKGNFLTWSNRQEN